MKNIAIIQPLQYTDIRQDKMIKSFVEKGYKVNIIFSKKNESKVTEIIYSKIDKNIKFYNLNTKIPVNIPFNFYRNKKINNILKELKPEVIICRDVLISGFISKNHSYKSYLDICDNFPEVLDCIIGKPLNKLANIICNYYERNAIKKFKNIIFVSEDSAKYVLGKHKMEYKQYIILENAPNKKKIGTNTNVKKLDFVYIGTINKKIRDIETVINAIEYSALKGVNITFDIYYFRNQIDIISEYKELVLRKNIDDRVNFYEAVPIEELPNILSKYRCGLVPHCRNKSTDYTIPNKLYDYLQQGIHVITSDNPSLKKFCDELNVTKYYLGGNYKSLSNVMIELLENNKTYENTNGKDIINNSLNWEYQFDKLYREL